MEVRTSTEKPYRYCWYGFGTVFQFQYQLGTNSVRFFQFQYQLGTVLRSGTVGTVSERLKLFFFSKNFEK